MPIRHDEASDGATVIDYSGEELPPQVLVVDDTEQIRNLLGVIVHHCGYRALKADGGLAARDIVINAHPALVICDLEMPVGSGWDLLTYCHDHLPKMPVILLSGGALGKRPEIECLAAGAFQKPLDLGRLRAEIKRLVPHAA